MKAARLRSEHVVRRGASAQGRPAAPKVVRLEDSCLWVRGGAKPRTIAPQQRQAPGQDDRSPQSGARLGKDVRVSLRLDGETHRRLKLVAACRQQSLQEALAGAVERYLRDSGPEALGEVTALLTRPRGEEN